MTDQMNQHYIVYGGDLSYFSRKLESAMVFYGADFESVPKTAANSQMLEQRTGTHQVPVLGTPEGWMIADTTPIIQMLDGRFPGRRMFPDGPLGLLVHILEDYFDEWIARTMVHYRWHYEESALCASERMGRGDARLAAKFRDWGPRACRATGTENTFQQDQAESEYLRIMENAEAQLNQTAFLLGDRPTAVDCVFLGSLRAHTNMDPIPKRQIAPYTRVIEWSETLADRWDGTGDLRPFPESTPFARSILGEIMETYVPYIRGNARALTGGHKAFVVETYGQDVSYLCRPYPEQARQMIQWRISQLLSSTVQAEVSQWLHKTGLTECFEAR